MYPMSELDNLSPPEHPYSNNVDDLTTDDNMHLDSDSDAKDDADPDVDADADADYLDDPQPVQPVFHPQQSSPPMDVDYEEDPVRTLLLCSSSLSRMFIARHPAGLWCRRRRGR